MCFYFQNELITVNPKYLDYCAIIFKLATKEEAIAWIREKRKSNRTLNDPRLSYYRAIDAMLNDQVLVNHNLLLEYYKYYKVLHKTNAFLIRSPFTFNQNME